MSVRLTGSNPRAAIDERNPESILGVTAQLASAWAARAEEAQLAEAIYFLDDACLASASGPRTILQDEMMDLLAEALGVELEVVRDTVDAVKCCLNQRSATNK